MFAVLGFFTSPIVKRFLPWIALALGVISAGWYINNKWDAYKTNLINQGRVTGRQEMADSFAAKIAANNAKNRQIEEQAKAALDKFKADYDKARAARVVKEDAAKASIEQQIITQPEFYTNPACTLPAEMLAERNRIRALGPK